uniref:Bbs-9 n=1 Tax=Pristionchus pacificus TaxID=54126 RepID=A0A2A6BM94_PRIPA|eukprot:PDM67072.1 bbs-9 [Pristionchus pacificus]
MRGKAEGIAMAQFVPQYSSHTLAVLTPKMLIMYDIEKGLRSRHRRESSHPGEQCVLSRLLSTSLHPGPIGVCHSSSSIIVGSSGTVRSVKYSLLTAHSVGGKKLNFDWALAVGDSVVDIQITQNESLPTIMVLCRKRLVALTSGGNLKFSFDLQCIGLALKSFNHGPTNYIISIVSTNTGALLVLKDNILMWTSHTPFVARYLDLCDAREAICMLTVADTNQMVVGYLGTEPSLYRIPIAPNRSVDYAAKRAQMAEFEEQIRLFGGGGVDIDGDEAPRATINVHADLQTETKSYMIANTKDASLIPLTFFIGDVPPVDPHITVAVHHESTQLILTASLPLSLIATPCSVARQAKHKVTLDVDGPTHDLTELLPDITSSPSHTNQIGLQILTTDVVVCILTAGKSNRYRIQSDSLDYLYLVTMKLMEGINEKNENARINVNFAVSSAVEAAENYVQLETKYEKEKEGLTKNAAEVRAMQAVLIPMTRNTKYTPLANLTLLIETTYNRLLSAIDSHAATGIRLNGLRRSLASALGVLSLSQHSLGSVAGLHFFEHTQQSLMTRLAWASKDNSGDIARMMLALLETTGPPIRSLMNIREEEEDEEEDENQDFKMGENATLGAYKEVSELVEEGDEERGREAEDDW